MTKKPRSVPFPLPLMGRGAAFWSDLGIIRQAAGLRPVKFEGRVVPGAHQRAEASRMTPDGRSVAVVSKGRWPSKTGTHDDDVSRIVSSDALPTHANDSPGAAGSNSRE